MGNRFSSLFAYLVPGERRDQREKVHKAKNEAARGLAELRLSSARLRRVVERIADEREKEDRDDYE